MLCRLQRLSKRPRSVILKDNVDCSYNLGLYHLDYVYILVITYTTSLECDVSEGLMATYMLEVRLIVTLLDEKIS